MTNSPVLLLVFNRPDTVLQVIASVKLAKPKKLYIAADGPRDGNLADQALCKETRENVLNNIDWDCKVKTLFRDENLGCKKGVLEAINWFFDNEENGVILEDDCVPDLSFFAFCEELLLRYKDDERIGMISGNNFGFELHDQTLSYSFSKHGLIWGWATWKRAWKLYDQMNFYLSPSETKLIKRNISSNSTYIELWWNEAQEALTDQESVWDYLWGIVRYSNNLLVVRPRVNLVANIGFGENATHTSGQADQRFSVSDSLPSDLVHPTRVVPDYIADGALEDFRVHAFQASQKKTTVSTIKKIKTKLHYIYLSFSKRKN